MTPTGDKCWRYNGGWTLVTPRSPREMKLEPMAVYYPRFSEVLFQYRVERKPKGAVVVAE